MRLARLWQYGRVTLACLLIGALPLFTHLFASAQPNISPWLSANAPSLEKLGDVLADNLPPTLAGSNIGCEKREIITRQQIVVPYPISKQSHAACMVNTSFGAVSNTGYLQRPGSTVYGDLRTSAGGTAAMIPIPYSATGLALSGGTSYGSYLWFYDNLDDTLKSTVIYNGEVNHNLPPTSTAGLRDTSGHLLAAQTDSMSFSANGEWMVVDIPFVAMVRVNTITREVLPFGDAINYGIGLGPAYRTAISPDGRYAVMASKVFDSFRLYDLSTCGSVPTSITTKVVCQSRDLLPFMKQKIPGFMGALNIKFNSDYTLNLYISAKQGTTTVFSHYVLNPDGMSASGFQYLALGDSFASGEGAYQYKSLTDTAENKCHLSQRSYPYLISSALGYGQSESVACSGAKIQDLIDTSSDFIEKETQAKGKASKDYDDDIYLNFLPGYRAQKNFINKYSPAIITLSAVGNDIGFSDKIQRCIGDDTCYSTYEDRLEIVQEINAQFPRLTDMYDQVKNAADPRSKIYVIGYPQIGDPTGNCALNVHLNHDELAFSQQLISYLNSVIKTAAANVGIAYVDVENAFSGHRLCETDSWNIAVNGLTAGNDKLDLAFIHGPIANESFHPNAFGQTLLKTKILDQTNNFTLPMPAANLAAVVSEPSAQLAILQAPRTNRLVRLIRNNTGINYNIIRTGVTWIQDYNDLAPFIKSNSSVHAWLNSEPVDLGTYTTVGSSLSLQVNLPSSTAGGFHTLHLYGKNTSNEDMDIYQTVYVLTQQNPGLCGGIQPSGQDTDKDNIDDSCDAFIAQPPLMVTPPPTITTPPTEIITVDSPNPTLPLVPTNTPITSDPPTLFDGTPLTEVTGPASSDNSPQYTDRNRQPTSPVIQSNLTNISSNSSSPMQVGVAPVMTQVVQDPPILAPQVAGIHTQVIPASSAIADDLTILTPKVHTKSPNYSWLLAIPITYLAVTLLVVRFKHPKPSKKS